MKLDNNEALEDSFIVLEAARKNADELKIAIRDFLKESPYKLVKYNSGYEQKIIVEQKIKTPNAIKQLLNNFLNNCRSSLEYLTGDLVRANNVNANCDNLYFPTADSEKKFLAIFHQKQVSPKQKKVAPKGIMQASDEVIAKLTEGEFYEGGKGSSIRGLHDLNNTTKHRHLIPSYSTVTLKNLKVFGLTIENSTGATNSDGTAFKAFDFGAPRNSMGERQSITEPELQFDDEVVFDIKIAGPECFSTQSLATVVDLIYKDTYELVSSFKEYV